MRELGRGDDRRVGDLHAVVQLVALLQPAQDRDRALDARLVDQHLLETALERGILLDVLAVFVERGRADAVQFAARQRRLEHVAGVDRAFRLAGADHRVELVDEDDQTPFLGADLLEDRLQALLELAAVLGACQQRREVERQHALALEGLGHFLVDDALGQSFDDRRLADAGLADEHGVVLGAPLQDLDGAADLVVAADHRIELARPGALGQVDRVLLERLALAFGFGASDRRAAAYRVDRGLERLARKALLARQPAGLRLVVGQRQQEQFARDVGVAALARFLVRGQQQRVEFAADVDLAVPTLDLRQPRNGRIDRGGEPADVDARARQERTGAAVVLLEHGSQDMQRLDVRVLVGVGAALGLGEGFLELGRQFVDSHGSVCLGPQQVLRQSFPGIWVRVRPFSTPVGPRRGVPLA